MLKVDSGPCVTCVGPRVAGHITRMVHNGFEYSDMEVIVKAYDVLKSIEGLPNLELHERTMSETRESVKVS